MVKWILAAGAAALAISTPSLAQQGGGNKGGGGKPDKAERGGGGGGKPVRVEQQGGGKQVRVEQRGGGNQQLRVDRKGGDTLRSADKGERMVARSKGDDRIKGGGKDSVRSAERRSDDRDLRNLDRDDVDGRRLVRFDDDDRGFRGLVGGCPPGLSKNPPFCMPSGQFKKIGSVLPAAFSSRMLDGPFQQWYRDDDRFFYRNDGDYIYRVNRDGGLIDALFPLADRDFSYYPIGMNYPSEFDQYNVPYQYRSFYPEGGAYDYRYGDGAIYQVNPSTNAIQSIVALLAGDLGVGQPMPLNYGAYNVPIDYRDRYYDTPDAMYRYNDGYIYRADPKTQLITAVIDAIV